MRQKSYFDMIFILITVMNLRLAVGVPTAHRCPPTVLPNGCKRLGSGQ